MNTPSQGQRGRKRKADKQQQHHPHQANRQYQQPMNEAQRRQQQTVNNLTALQDKAFPQTPAPFGPASMLTVADVGSGMGPGIAIDDEFADNLVDDLDRITPRDLASARYARNHEMLDSIFDARRVDKIDPPFSYYSTLKKQDLESKLSNLQSEISDLTSLHSKRLKPISQIISEEESSLSEAPEASWGKDPSKGKVLGIAFIRASTPPEAREFLEKQKQSLALGARAKPSNEDSSETEEHRLIRERELIDKVNLENGVGIQPSTLVENQDSNMELTSQQQESGNDNGNGDESGGNGMGMGESNFDELLAASGLSADTFDMDFGGNDGEGGTPHHQDAGTPQS